MSRHLVLIDTIYTQEQLERVPAGPQIALAGRSNVGKSTLVNALAGAKKLAKISATPGKTRSLNFYRVEPVGYMLADLPGYGYARCSKTERASWGQLIEAYLSRTADLKAVAVLIDCRIPTQTLDLDMTSFVSRLGLPLIPVLTKVDKCSQAERSRRRDEWSSILRGARPVLFSGKSGFGMDALWRALDEAALADPAPETAAEEEEPA